MTIKEATVKNIAHLARISLTDSDIAKFQHDLSDILDMMDVLQKVDTENIEPLLHPTSTSLHLRPDQVTEKSNGNILKLSQKNEAGMYLVPKVIE